MMALDSRLYKSLLTEAPSTSQRAHGNKRLIVICRTLAIRTLKRQCHLGSFADSLQFRTIRNQIDPTKECGSETLV